MTFNTGLNEVLIKQRLDLPALQEFGPKPEQLEQEKQAPSHKALEKKKEQQCNEESFGTGL